VEGKVKPGQYFVLKFDFSRATRSLDVAEADKALKRMISTDFELFYDTYGMYLGEDASKKINPDDPADSLTRCVMLVNKALKDARQRGDKALADVQGVRMASFFCLVLLVLTTEYLSTDLPPC
jgi:hypothetical protein